MPATIRLKLLCLLIGLLPYSAWAGEYDFEIPEIEKKPYEIGGSIEVDYTVSRLDKDSALYHQRFYNRDEGSAVDAYGLALQLEGSYQKGVTKLFLKTNTDLTRDYLGCEEDTKLYEGLVSVKPAPSFTLEAGKKVMKWGKGYAWNPVAFTSTPKDPEDPEQSLEGYTLISADLIKSLSGPAKTIAFTPVIFPVYEDINSEFGKTGHFNYAGKLYLLAFDTDVDIMFFTGESIEDRVGLDFSKNIMPNFEVHGEAAVIDDFEKWYIDKEGVLHSRRFNAISYLLGIRYLNKYDTTFIVEYYRNGKGFSKEEIGDYYQFIEDGYNTYQATGAESQLKKSLHFMKAYYSEKNFMKDYVYLKMIQKEPFDILYFSSSLGVIYNAADGSYSLTPELLYEPTSNLELKFKLTFFHGDCHSEFGEKPYDYKALCLIKYYF